jgi:hypothetical protein
LARIDDYRESFRLAALELRTVNLHRCAKLSGADIDLEADGTVRIRLAFLGEPYLVSVKEEVDIRRENQAAEVSLPEKILIAHYLLRASGESPTGNLITFRQIPDGHFYYDAFQRRARDPFLAIFGQQPELFRRCAAMLGGKPVDTADVGMDFQVLPRIAIRLALWQGDEEFAPEASILFDESIKDYFPVEDIAVISGMLVYRLMGLARQQQAAAAR